MATLVEFRYMVAVSDWVHSLHAGAVSAAAMAAKLVAVGMNARVFDFQGASAEAIEGILGPRLCADLARLIEQAGAAGVAEMLQSQDAKNTILVRPAPFNIGRLVDPSVDPPELSDDLQEALQRATEAARNFKSVGEMTGARLVAMHLFIHGVIHEQDSSVTPSNKTLRLKQIAEQACEAGYIFDQVANDTFNPRMPDLGRTGPDERTNRK
jgi:hypothetical protein